MIKKISFTCICITIILLLLSGCIDQKDDEKENYTHPKIYSFSAEPDEITLSDTIQVAQLNWHVEGYTKIVINPGDKTYYPDDIITAPMVHPTETTTYTLTAYNETATATATTTITVKEKEPTINIDFLQNKTSGTLTVTNVSLDDIPWNKIQVEGGTKPSEGYVKIGDIITRYVSSVKITYDNTTNIGSWNFFDDVISLPVVEFSQNVTSKTLTVTKVTDSHTEKDISWENIQVIGGTKPTGQVNVGDTITDCSDTVRVIYRYIDYLGDGIWEF